MATNSKITKAELEARNADLEAQLAEIRALLAATVAAQKTTPVVPTTTPASNGDVTIVYCSDSMGYASLSNIDLHFNCYGEEFILSRYQFDELVGKYRRWFDRGVLAVSYKNIDVAAAKGLRTDREFALSASILNSIGKMTPAQLEKLWNDNSGTLEHQKSIVSFIKRKFIEGDQAYRNREKIDLMNRLTNGGFEREQDELAGRYKIRPTEM